MASSSTDVVLRDFTVARYANEWKQDASPQTEGTLVNAPVWMSDMYGQLCAELTKVGGVLRQVRQSGLDPEESLPGLVRIYEELLREQNHFYEALSAHSAKWLQTIARETFARYEVASTQFASQVNMAIEYVHLAAEQRSNEMGQHLLKMIEEQANHNLGQMARVGSYLSERDALIRSLQSDIQSGGAALATLRMEVSELQAHSASPARLKRQAKTFEDRERRQAQELRNIRTQLFHLEGTVERELSGNVSDERRLLLKQLVKEVNNSVSSVVNKPDLEDIEMVTPEDEVEDETHSQFIARVEGEIEEDIAQSQQFRRSGGSAPPPVPPRPGQTPAADPPSSHGSSSSHGSLPERRPRIGRRGISSPPPEPPAGREKASETSSGRKKPPINKPKSYAGDRNATPTYRQWFRVLEDYLDYHQATYDSDQDKITIVGSHMEGKARDWYDSRKRQMKALHLTDNFASFCEAMDARFKTDKEDHVNLRKMKKVQYNGDVQAYIDSLEHLNLKVGLSGLAWRDILKNGLPDDISYRLSLTQGGEPQEDDALIIAIREHGLAHERRLDEKKGKGDNPAPSSSKSKKRKRGDQGSPETPAPKKPKETGSGGRSGQGNAPKGSGDPVFAATDREVAHKGIPQTLIDKRMKAEPKQCTRCGYDNHRWMYCRKEAVVSSARKLRKAAAALKGDQNGKGTVKPEPNTTDGKVSAVKAGKKPFQRKLTVRHPVVESDGSREILTHLNMKAGISSGRVSKPQTVASSSSSRSRVYEVQSEDEN